jgi:hypothetical protein
MANGVFNSVPGEPAVNATATGDLDAIDASADSGFGLFISSNTSNGVYASSNSSQGVYGICQGNSDGVVGNSLGSGTGVGGLSSTGNGVAGTQMSPTGDVENAGVFGSSLAADGNGVIGEANNGSDAYGVWGRSTSGYAGYFEGNVQVIGNLAATGTKPFIQAHPTDPSKEIVYVALEGGEAGTYVRGVGQVVNGKAMIALPEHFALVTNNQDLSVQLTPRGAWLQLYVVELDTTLLVVREAQSQSGVFDYLIHGIRRGYEQHEVIRRKR